MAVAIARFRAAHLEVQDVLNTDAAYLGCINILEILGKSAHRPRHAIYMEKPLDVVWVGPRFEWGTVSGNQGKPVVLAYGGCLCLHTRKGEGSAKKQ